MVQVNIGKGINLEVDTNRLNAEVMAHVVYIGLRNILMDSHAGDTPEKHGDLFLAKSEETAKRKLETLYAGEVRVAGTREGDPIKREALVIAFEKVKEQYRKAGKKIAANAKEIRADAAKLAENPAVVTLAKKRVKDAAALKIEM